MKHIIVPILAVLVAVSCNQNGFTVTGTVNSNEEGLQAVMVDIFSNATDTVDVVGGKFTFKGEADETTIKAIMIPGITGQGSYAEFVPETGNTSVSFGDKTTVKGGVITESYNKFVEEYNSVYEQYSEGSITEAEADARLKEITIAAYNANKTNAVGLFTMQLLVYDLQSEELESMLEDASEQITSDETIATVREAKQVEARTAEGKMFVDFSGKTPEGTPVSLSDFVGKGKYVLVDFWASWCGPCKREIPNIKSLYEKYTGDKFQVLGVAVWDNDNTASAETMKELGMKWDQIFVGDDRTPTDNYGIVGIPHIILFAPDGTIYKRNLRGEEMISTVASLFE